MSNQIQKINNLKKLDGFIQLNFSKGFKYVDKAGEFFNHFYKGDNFPKYIMDTMGMTVRIDEKTQLKVSPHNLWMHFIEPDTFDYQSRMFLEKAILVNSIFEPEKYTRIGWRSYFVYECGDKYPSIIPDGYLEGSEFNEIVFTKIINKLDVRISVSRIIKEKADIKAILFDMDFSKSEDFDNEDFSNNTMSFLHEIEEAYKSEDLLVVINNILK